MSGVLALAGIGLLGVGVISGNKGLSTLGLLAAIVSLVLNPMTWRLLGTAASGQ